ncbi:MAG: hypothetical protein Kow0010_17310 [Dehalococcoidia bacterium]
MLLVATVGVVFALRQDAAAAVTGSIGSQGVDDATPDPGQTVTFTAPVTFIANTNGVTTVEIDLNDSLTNVTADCSGLDTTTGGPWTASVGAGNVATCTSAGGITASTSNMVVTASAPTAGGSYPNGNWTLSDADNSVFGAFGLTLTVTGIASDFNADETNALGLEHSVTFTLPANIVCRSDDGTDPDGTTRSCTANDFGLPTGATNIAVSATGARNAAGTATVTWTGSQAASSAISILLTNLNGAGTGDDVLFTATTAGVKTYVAAELRHMNGGTVLTAQDIPNDVRGHRHTVCVVAADTGIDLNGDGDFTDANEVAPVALQIPLSSFNQVNVTAGGGHTSINDPDPTFTDPVFFTGDGTNGLQGASCFSWISTEAGDQELTVQYTGDDGNAYTVRWDNQLGGNGALIKEWNVLEDSQITLSGGASATGIGSDDTEADPTVHVTVPAIFNPANSSYQITAINVADVFRGSHITRTGSKWGPGGLWGVEYTVSLDSTCGLINNGTADITGVTGPSGTITFTITSGDDCTLNDQIVVTITGQEPGPLGSGDGIEVTQVIVIDLTTPVATKQVFLAWAGQRVILEHDWRLPPGDVDGNADGEDDGGGTDDDPDPDPVGQCAFGDFFQVTYIKGSGPGNFLPGPNDDGNSGVGVVALNGSDQAVVTGIASDLSGDNDWGNQQDNDGGDDDGDGDLDDTPNGPQDSCISRVLFESEDQGQVDIEAFVTGIFVDGEFDNLVVGADPASDPANYVPLIDNQTKVAFVIYYMKLESVETSLVTSVEKPNHNSSAAPDWAPGNPWDASTDVFATEWNVSKDLLVRVRVKGWFTNSNPSGRPAEQKNATGDFLPADRWVMPDDWARLAGGEVATQFRPEYDLMIAPNNAKGLLCDTPTGGCSEVLTATGAQTYGIPAPVEGPYSLLDFPGPGSAALSNVDSNNVRETIVRDGAIDMWDAPMPPALLAVDIRGAGFIKAVFKDEVYYTGTPNSALQDYTNPFYVSNIPDSPFIPAVVAGGGYFWDSWGNDGPGGNGDGVYDFWTPLPDLIATAPGKNWAGVSDTSVTSTQKTELDGIRAAYGDDTIGRTLVLYTDNHGEAMVAANGDFKLDYSGCAVNAVYGSPHCDTGDVVGSSSIFATADYPDFRGKHPPVQSFSATVDWTWGGYKDVTIEDGETEQFKYVVLHVKDRDGFCSVPAGAVSLHPVLGESVDFLIDGGEGKIVDSAQNGTLSGERGAADGVKTFSTAVNTTLKEFPTLDGSTDECQAWIKVSSSLLDIVNVLVTAHDPEGKVGFDVLVDFTSTFQYQLTFRWSLITWVGADGISPEAALKGEGANAGGTNIFDKVTAVYGWNQSAQAWLGFFPAAASLPGVNDLSALTTGQAYWIAVTENTAWTVITDVN